MKQINGLAKNEKILFYSKESIIYFLFRQKSKIFIFIGLILFIEYVGLFLGTNLAYLVLLLNLFGVIVFYIFWDKTYFIITNKRLIKFIRSGIFTEHMKELKLDQLNELTYSIKGFFNKMLNIGNIKIVGKDKENVIYFTGIENPDEVVQYISRLRDYIFENPDYDIENISEFRLRKERNK